MFTSWFVVGITGFYYLCIVHKLMKSLSNQCRRALLDLVSLSTVVKLKLWRCDISNFRVDELLKVNIRMFYNNHIFIQILQ